MREPLCGPAPSLCTNERATRTQGAGGAGVLDPQQLDDELDGVYLMLERLRQRALNADDIERLGRAADAYHAGRGEVSFDRCLGLRGRHESWRIGQRNRWIARAASLMPRTVGVEWLPYVKLEETWCAFIASGPWRRWRDDACPPKSASALERALFFASTHNRGEHLGAKQIRRIVDNFSRRNVSGSPIACET